MTYDPRLTPARPDLSAEHLRGQVTAEQYSIGTPHQVIVSIAPVTGTSDAAAPLVTELLYGERFTVYECSNDFAWGQGTDGYVGYVPLRALTAAGDAPTHQVHIPLTHLYPEPEFKGQPLQILPALSSLTVIGQSGRFLEVTGGWVPGRHVQDISLTNGNWVEWAEQLLGVPYLWGGRSALGIDCSGLVQIARLSAGHLCLRDADMQQGMGDEIAKTEPLSRGDLIFWDGHVGIMRDAETLLHANIFHMAVASEPLELAVDRIITQGGGPVTARRRLQN